MDNNNINDALRKKIHMLLDSQLPEREKVKLTNMAISNPVVQSEIENTREFIDYVKCSVKRPPVSAQVKATIEQIFLAQS